MAARHFVFLPQQARQKQQQGQPPSRQQQQGPHKAAAKGQRTRQAAAAAGFSRLQHDDPFDSFDAPEDLMAADDAARRALQAVGMDV